MSSLCYSVVVPACDEEQRLPATLARIAEYFEARRASFEVLVVLDGCTDGSAGCVSAAARAGAPVRALSFAENRGKGAAVREGMRAARGALRLFSDADLSTPIEELEKLEGALEAGADLAMGSRALAGSDVRTRQPWWREQMGRSFNLCARALLDIGFRDTQCGFKLFRAPAALELFERQRLEGFGFDVELVWIARRLGLAVAEVPVVWINSPRSTVNPLRDSASMLADLARIRWHDWRGRYAQPGAPGAARGR